MTESTEILLRKEKMRKDEKKKTSLEEWKRNFRRWYIESAKDNDSLNKHVFKRFFKKFNTDAKQRSALRKDAQLKNVSKEVHNVSSRQEVQKVSSAPALPCSATQVDNCVADNKLNGSLMPVKQRTSSKDELTVPKYCVIKELNGSAIQKENDDTPTAAKQCSVKQENHISLNTTKKCELHSLYRSAIEDSKQLNFLKQQANQLENLMRDIKVQFRRNIRMNAALDNLRRPYVLSRISRLTTEERLHETYKSCQAFLHNRPLLSYAPISRQPTPRVTETEQNIENSSIAATEHNVNNENAQVTAISEPKPTLKKRVEKPEIEYLLLRPADKRNWAFKTANLAKTIKAELKANNCSCRAYLVSKSDNTFRKSKRHYSIQPFRSKPSLQHCKKHICAALHDDEATKSDVLIWNKAMQAYFPVRINTSFSQPYAENTISKSVSKLTTRSTQTSIVDTALSEKELSEFKFLTDLPEEMLDDETEPTMYEELSSECNKENVYKTFDFSCKQFRN